MTRKIARPTALAAAVLVAATGCTPFSEQAKVISAGHTGCTPEQLTISNLSNTWPGNVMWNATCNGKVYLCSGVTGKDYSCAPVAK